MHGIMVVTLLPVELPILSTNTHVKVSSQVSRKKYAHYSFAYAGVMVFSRKSQSFPLHGLHYLEQLEFLCVHPHEQNGKDFIMMCLSLHVPSDLHYRHNETT